MFVAIVVALGLVVWMGLSILRHRNLLPDISSVTSDQSVTVGVVGSPDSLDVRTDADPSVEQALLGNVYETLVARDQDNALTPGLAESWEVSDDGLTYTFTIRDGVRFSNGDGMDSSDVVWSLQQIVQNQYQGAEDLDRLAEVGNPDGSTVVVTLSKPDPTLLRSLAGRAGIVYDADADIDYQRQAVGTGPFTVRDFRQGVAIGLQRNDSYWGDHAATENITLRYYDDEDGMVTALRDGDATMAVRLSAATAQSLSEDPTLNVAAGRSLTKMVLAFNNDADSILSDSRMRQALRYLVDNETLAGTQPGADLALGGPIGPLDPGYEDLTSLFPHDVDQGAALASYFGTGYYNNGLRLVVQERYRDLAGTIEGQIEQGGVPVDVQVLDEANYRTAIDARQFDMTLMTVTGDDTADAYADPSSFSHYTDSAAQEQYRAAMDAASDGAYVDGLKTFARTVSEDAASDWLYSCDSYVAAQPRLKGYPTNMVENWLPLSGVELG